MTNVRTAALDVAALLRKADDFSDPVGRVTALDSLADGIQTERDSLLRQACTTGLSPREATRLAELTRSLERTRAAAQHAMGCI